jgi:hypothetical protein
VKGKWKGLGFLAFDSVISSQLVYMVGKGEGKGKGLNFLAFDSVTFSQQVYMVGEGEGIMFFSL